MAPAKEDDDRPIGTNYTDKGPKPERGRSVNLLLKEKEKYGAKSVKICIKVEFAYFHTRFLKFDHLEWWVGNAKQVGGVDVCECEGLVHDDVDFDGGSYMMSLSVKV